MPLLIATANDTAQTLFARAQRLSDSFWWDVTLNAGAGGWANNPTLANRRISLTEGTEGADTLGQYSASIVGMGDAGLVRVTIHDDAASNAVIGGPYDVYVMGGNEVTMQNLVGYVDTLETVIATLQGVANTINTNTDTLEASATAISNALTALSSAVGALPTTTGIVDAVAALFGTPIVISGSPTALAFTGTGLASSEDDFYNRQFVMFYTGALNGATPVRVRDYDGATGILTVTPALPAAPAVGDKALLLGKAG